MISENLKEETKFLHAETEKRLNAKRIFSEDFTIQEYQQILQILYIAHEILEQQLENIITPNLNKFYKDHYTLKYPLIRKDLEKLKASVKAYQLPPSKGLNDLNALGILYVLNGSSMGAKYINKQLQGYEIKWSNFSNEFYKASASITLDEWKNFCYSLDSLGLNANEIEQVIEGAKYAFNTFIDAGKSFC